MTDQRKPVGETVEKCNHKWIFQETQQKRHTTNNNGHYTAHFERVDVYYCEKCLEIKNIEQGASVSLPYGGIHNVLYYAPVWYNRNTG